MPVHKTSPQSPSKNNSQSITKLQNTFKHIQLFQKMLQLQTGKTEKNCSLLLSKFGSEYDHLSIGDEDDDVDNGDQNIQMLTMVTIVMMSMMVMLLLLMMVMMLKRERS